jgi:hypothetical protein
MNPFENERKEIDEYSQDELERIYGAQPEYDEDDWYDAFDEEPVSVEDPDDPELLDAPEDLDPPEDFDGYWADLDEPQVDEIEEISADAPTPDDFEDEETEWPEWKEEEEEVVEESAPLTEDVLTEGPFKAIGAKIFDGKLKKLFKNFVVGTVNYDRFVDAENAAKTQRARDAVDPKVQAQEVVIYGVLADNFKDNANLKKFLDADDQNRVKLETRTGNGDTGVDYSKQVLEKLKKWQAAEKAASKGTSNNPVDKVNALIDSLPTGMTDANNTEVKEKVIAARDAFKALTPDQQKEISDERKTKLNAALTTFGLPTLEPGEPTAEEEAPPTEDAPPAEETETRGNTGLAAANRAQKAYRALNSLGITDREQQKKIIQALQAALGGNK